jgi:serine/threonine-protein kinase
MFCSRCGVEVQNNAKFCPSCGLDLAATTPIAAIGQPLEESELTVVAAALKDEYEILEELGRGGMAIVFRARERELDREVAIKVLPFSLGFDAEFVERFQREARTAARLEHPHIIPIYRVGNTGRVIYFVMKLLRGESLSEVLEKGGAVPPKEIKRILAQTAGALGYAHKNEIVHRDIKPDNIMFDETGHAILTDFGIAKAATGTRLTGTGMSIGTPHYMSPEQARAQPLDGRSDLYSLGVVAYQCLTGSVPFDGEDSFAIGYKHIMEDLPEPDLPTAEHRELFQAIRRMMAKSQDDRFQSADELVAVLEHGTPLTMRGAEVTISTAPTTAIPRPPPPSTVPRAVSPSTPTTPIPGAVDRTFDEEESEKGREGKRKKGGILVGFLALLLVGGGGAGGYWYFFMDAQWPPFVARGTAGPQTGIDSGVTDSAAVDSLLGDSLLTAALMPDDSLTDRDSTGAAADTTTPVSELPNTGEMLVTIPEGATLKIDGSPAVAGDTLELDAGSHRVEVEQDGYEKYDEMVNVGRGVRLVLPIPRLVPAREPPQQQPPPDPEPVRPAPVDICGLETPSAEYFRNAQGRCYDSPPMQHGISIITMPDRGEDMPQQVDVFVKVGTDGGPLLVVAGRRARADVYTLAARRFARDSLQYTAAMKDGRPIEAWARVPVRFRRQP